MVRKFLRTNGGRYEKLHDPDYYASLAEVVADIKDEERFLESKLREARTHKVRSFPDSICDESPTSAHHYVYPKVGERGRAKCKYCDKREK